MASYETEYIFFFTDFCLEHGELFQSVTQKTFFYTGKFFSVVFLIVYF